MAARSCAPGKHFSTMAWLRTGLPAHLHPSQYQPVMPADAAATTQKHDGKSRLRSGLRSVHGTAVTQPAEHGPAEQASTARSQGHALRSAPAQKTPGVELRTTTQRVLRSWFSIRSASPSSRSSCRPADAQQLLECICTHNAETSSGPTSGPPATPITPRKHPYSCKGAEHHGQHSISRQTGS